MDPEEVRRQVRIMAQMGLGGFFIHSRSGLRTPYLSEAWFRAVEAAVDEARQLHLEAWLYDEDLWPSGSAGGRVGRDPSLRMHSLVLSIHDHLPEPLWTADTMAVFIAASVDGAAARGIRAVAAGEAPLLQSGERVLRFQLTIGGYIDTLNPQAVARFIELTHEAYRQRVGEAFGETIPGMFTDECHRGNMVALGAAGWEIPWTPGLPAAFRDRHGYDLLPHLPEIFFAVDEQAVTPARLHYHDTVCHLFTEAFARQIGDWCARHDLQFTGHILWEELLSTQTMAVGSCLRFYAQMQAPGMDILTEHTRYFALAKQVSSVARQCGRRWRLTETYGCTGWDFPFAGHKAIGDWQTALGINLRCQHLSLYSMAGLRKRDFPASILHQSPWWEQYPVVEDYFARLHAVMTCGEEVRDLLVIHPIESMWARCHIGWWESAETRRIDRAYVALADELLAAHLDFDYGDEEMLARLGSIEMQDGAPVLRLGQATYRAVLVPALVTIRQTTLDLLERFRTAGGQVVYLGPPPRYVDGVRSAMPCRLARAWTKTRATAAELDRTLSPACRRVSITDAEGKEVDGILYLLREDAEGCYLYLCNTGLNARQWRGDIYTAPRVADRMHIAPHAIVTLTGAGTAGPVELDPTTGEVFAANAKRHGDQWCITTAFDRLTSRLFVFPSAPLPQTPSPRPDLRTHERRVLPSADWTIHLTEANNLLLDTPRWRLNGGPWQEPAYMLWVDNAVRDALAIPRRNPWTQPYAFQSPPEARQGDVELEYTFEIRTVPANKVYLALECPARYRITLNGISVPTEPSAGWWVDKAIHLLPLAPAWLQTGTNCLRLACGYEAFHPGLEALHLVGDFGVRLQTGKPAITRMPRTLHIGTWTSQGLPFYSGSVVYEQEVDLPYVDGGRLFVALPRYQGVCARVWVDGKPAGITAWPPQEVEITDYAVKGHVHLGIEIIGHRGNSHGPLHFNARWPYAIGNSGSFEPDPQHWSDAYQLRRCGLLAPPELIMPVPR